MHLLNVFTLGLEKSVKEKGGRVVEKYGVLSHRWLAKDDEVLFQDFESRNATVARKPGYSKLLMCCKQARRDGLKYVWIDTCCINKIDSSELQESINSMYHWYENAEKCYVYLKDTSKPKSGPFKLGKEEEWFERGWTLQELIAPKDVKFYDKDWEYLGDKASLKHFISGITGIRLSVLEGTKIPQECSVAERMSWASGRRATKAEDRVYSLIGLFGVNMPAIYGEGEVKATLRLQEEIMKTSDDWSIFAWKGVQKASGLLATNLDAFSGCQTMRSIPIRTAHSMYSLTNRGVSVTLNLTPWTVDTYLAPIPCQEAPEGNGKSTAGQLCIFLQRLEADDQYARVSLMGKDFASSTVLERVPLSRELQISVRQRNIETEKHAGYERLKGFRLSSDLVELCSKAGYWNAQEQTLVFRPGSPPGKLEEFGVLRNVGLLTMKEPVRKIKLVRLAFDFGFNPTLFLCESSAIKFKPRSTGDEGQAYINGAQSVWGRSPDDSIEWNQLVTTQEKRRALEHPVRRGLWALKGDRIDGLDVYLASSDIRVVLSKMMTESGILVWDLRIDNLRENNSGGGNGNRTSLWGRLKK
ncbi:HET-domain-containing protein [Hypoxylon crocopeplum]|nr:HET-domain-containing protein [Hypoxylon crocopeplum]